MTPLSLSLFWGLAAATFDDLEGRGPQHCSFKLHEIKQMVQDAGWPPITTPEADFYPADKRPPLNKEFSS